MMIDVKDIEMLQHLAKTLVKTGHKEIIEEITNILSKYSSVSFDYICTEYDNLIKARLGEA